VSCCTDGGKSNAYIIWWENLKEICDMKDLDVEGKIILILKRNDMRGCGINTYLLTYSMEQSPS
jgi:hypothetical protein